MYKGSTWYPGAERGKTSRKEPGRGLPRWVSDLRGEGVIQPTGEQRSLLGFPDGSQSGVLGQAATSYGQSGLSDQQWGGGSVVQVSCTGGLWRDGDPAGTLYGKQISDFQGEEGIRRRERHICIRSQNLSNFTP